MPPRAKHSEIFVAAIIFSFLSAGCGKMGDPVPRNVFSQPAIADLNARVEKNDVILSWSGQTGRAAYFRILRNETATNMKCPGCYREYTKLADVSLKDVRLLKLQRDEFLYHDAAVRPGFSYLYTVMACDGDNFCSEKSNAVEINFP